MPITPTRSTTLPSNLASIQPEHPKSSREQKRLAEDPGFRADEEERAARDRIVRAHNQVEEAERESRAQLNEVRDSFSAMAMKEQALQEGSVERERQKGYEAIRELQRQQQAELSKLRSEGEKQIRELAKYYNDTNYQIERDGREKMQELNKLNARQTSYEEMTSRENLGQNRKEHEMRMSELRAKQRDTLEHLKEQSLRERDRMKTGYAQAREDAEKSYLENHAKTVAMQNETLNELRAKATDKIHEIREDTSQKLSAYASRQRDPFYKMVDLDVDLSERDDHFLVTATIPEHEQKHVSIAIRGSEVVVSGYRRNEEKLELGPGHKVGTASFQSYSESFPLSWPVEPRQVTKEFDGDRMIVKIPKKTRSETPLFKAHRPERERPAIPQFPENLPHTAAAKRPDPDAEPPEHPSPKTRGSRTLL